MPDGKEPDAPVDPELTANSPPDKPRKKKKGRLAALSEYILFRGVEAGVSRLSDAGVSRVGRHLGGTAARLLTKRRLLASRNLELAFPEKSQQERDRILQGCWEHFGRAAIEYVRGLRMSQEELASRCRLIRGEEFDRALSLDRGVIVVSAHLGNWEVAANFLSRYGRKVTTVARPLDNELLERDLARSRHRFAVSLLDRRRAARSLVRALEEKSIVVLLADQAVQPREGILVPFLGRPAWTTSAPAKLARKFRVPIVVGFCIPVDGFSEVGVEDVFLPEELPEDEQSVEAITLRINDVISRKIRELPELWLWMHDRWKGTGWEG